MSDQPEPIPPYAPAAERAILGSILIDPECIRSLSIQPEDFYLIRHGWIYAAAQDLIAHGQTPDYVTICTILDERKQLTESGGAPYINELINSCPSSLNVISYAKTIKDRSTRRALLQAANNLAISAYNLEEDIDAGISRAMDRLSKAKVSEGGLKPIGYFLSKVYDELDQAAQNPTEYLGIPTGFIDWDHKTGGLVKKTVFKLSGDPGVGKSLLSFQVLINAAKKGYRCALFEIEMPGEQVIWRELSGKTEVPTRLMKTGHVPEAKWSDITHAIEEMASLGVEISDKSEMTTSDIRVECQRAKELHGLDLIVIDYEDLLTDYGSSENEASSLKSARIKAIAKDLDIAIITIGGMTKEGIQKRTSGMGAQMGTGRSQHDRDEIATLREDPDTQNLFYLHWDKFREGTKPKITLVRTPGLPIFRDAVPPKARSNGQVKVTARELFTPE